MNATHLVRALALAAALGLPTAMLAGDDELGVTDFTRADPKAIQESDIAEALAPNRALRRPTRARLPIYFESNSARLTSDGEALLANTARAVQSQSLEGFRFRIEGHTDGQGSEAYNEGLSVRRAESVRDFLVANGVTPKRLIAVGEGESSPVASNDDSDGRKRNRRVEVVNIGPAE